MVSALQKLQGQSCDAQCATSSAIQDTIVHRHPSAYKHSSKALRPHLTKDDSWQGDFVVLASEPVCICGVDVAAPQQLRARNSQHKMSMAELRSIFSRQFTDYEVRKVRPAKPPLPKRGVPAAMSSCRRLASLKLSSRHRQRGTACRLLEVQGEGDG